MVLVGEERSEERERRNKEKEGMRKGCQHTTEKGRKKDIQISSPLSYAHRCARARKRGSERRSVKGKGIFSSSLYVCMPPM